MEEARASLLDGLEETCAAPVWKMKGQVIRAAWAADLKRAVQMRAQEMELAQAVLESKQTGRSSRGCLDGRKRPGRPGTSVAYYYRTQTYLDPIERGIRFKPR